MVRSVVAALLALPAVVIAARAADGDVVWEPAGPVATSTGMSAVATDPDNPKVVWLGSATSVWVSDDEGQSFQLVLQLPRAAGLVRETGPGGEEITAPEEEDEPDGLEPEEEEALEPTALGEELDPGAVIVETAEDVETEGGETVAEVDIDEEVAPAQARFGVVRLRPLGDLLYVCTSRGLFTVDRAARTLGTGRELRFGRRIAVNDVAATPDGAVWIATDGGLVQLGSDGVGRPARGLEEDLAVNAVLVAEGRLVLATSRGLRISGPQPNGAGGFDRLAQGGREEQGLEDVVLEPEARLLVTGGGQVARILARPGEIPISEEAWTVPGASRLALGRDGARWVVGANGAWRWRAEGGFERVSTGLFDRRLRDVASGAGPSVQLWAVGRSGAWRLVPDTGKGYSGAAQRLAATALEGFPTDDEVLGWAVKSRGISLPQIDAWATEERLSWLLPRVEVLGRFVRQRDEDFQHIPILDRRVLQVVEVRPVDDEIRVMAYWDVMPALIVALEGSRSTYETSRASARRQLERVREVIVPIYQTWAKKRIDLAATEGIDVREAVREMLAIQRLESDLHVYTGGRFPVTGTDIERPGPKRILP